MSRMAIYCRAPGKPMCQYGTGCYRRNPIHFEQEDHPDEHPLIQQSAFRMNLQPAAASTQHDGLSEGSSPAGSKRKADDSPSPPRTPATHRGYHSAWPHLCPAHRFRAVSAIWCQKDKTSQRSGGDGDAILPGSEAAYVVAIDGAGSKAIDGKPSVCKWSAAAPVAAHHTAAAMARTMALRFPFSRAASSSSSGDRGDGSAADDDAFGEGSRA